MMYEREREQFERDGFVIIRSLLSPADFSALNENLDRYIREVVPTLADSHAFYQERGRPETLKQMQHMQGDAYFAAYSKHPAWVGLAEGLLGEPAGCETPEWFNKPPGTQHVTPPHQDNYYFNLKPPSVATLWMALDHVDDENGCLRYVAGSHRRGLRPHARSGILGFSQGITDFGPADEAREVKVHLAPGDVVAHHGETIHRAEANRSPVRNRRAFAMVYNGASCRRDEDAFARYQASLQSQHKNMGLNTEGLDTAVRQSAGTTAS